MKKFFSILIISLLICETGFTKILILHCSDVKLVGFDGKSQYSVKDYRPLKFQLKIDMDEKKISSNNIGGFDYPDSVKCNFWKAFKEYDPMLECMSTGYYIAINLFSFKYTRSRGYGYAFGKEDDIGTGYGVCKEI